MPRPYRPRVLLLLPSTTYRTAAFVEAARGIGTELTVASERPSTFEQANTTGLLTLDFAHPERATGQAAAFAREHPIDAVVGVDDDTAVLAAAVAERLHLKGNPVHAALAARDKHRQRLLLVGAGVPVPRFAEHGVGEDAAVVAEQISYPCVLKPLRLSASRGVMRADTPADFVVAVARLKRILEQPDLAVCGEPGRRFLVEDFIHGDEFALEGLVVGGRLHVLALFDKPDPLNGPFFEETIYLTPSRLPVRARKAIAECTAAAAAALGLQEGPIHAELRYNERGPWLIELAGRPIGGRCSAVLRFEPGMRDAGSGMRSLEEIILAHALGWPVEPLQREALAAGVMMIPVPGAGVLREMRGLAEARAVPLVEEVLITAHRGERLVPLPEGARYPGFIFARGDTADAVEAALRRAHAQLEFELE